MTIGSGGLFLLLLVMLMGIDANYFPTILAVMKQKRAPVVEALGNFARLSRSFMIMTTIFGAIVAVLNLILLLVLDGARRRPVGTAGRRACWPAGCRASSRWWLFTGSSIR